MLGVVLCCVVLALEKKRKEKQSVVISTETYAVMRAEEEGEVP